MLVLENEDWQPHIRGSGLLLTLPLDLCMKDESEEGIDLGGGTIS
jgi:hypothetical protein